MKAISLFSSIGIAEYYLSEIGVDVIVACELEKKRALTYEAIYPYSKIVTGDITRKEIKDEIYNQIGGLKIDLIIATPPCQGVSLAGINKKEADYINDKRNYLVLEALEIFDKLQSDYLLIENVPRFDKMLFPNENSFLTLEELLLEKYSDIYNVDVSILNSSDFFVPQNRNRIVYRVWRKGRNWNIVKSNEKISLREAIGHLPSLESGEKSSVINHHARVHPKNHIECMMHTPTSKSAFDNDKYYPKRKDGKKIRGFNNTYKRMSWDVPAPTITMRNEIISSQENVHPGRKKSDGTYSDARVLTLREILIVSSLPPDMEIPPILSERQFRMYIGEGIPPLMIKEIVKGVK